MENKTLKRWEWIGFIFVLALGSLSHFFYEWSGENRIIGTFSAVNESTWEHLKLLFFPMLLFTIIEYFAIGKKYPNFIFAKAIGILSGLAAIIVFFYTYTGILGTNIMIVDILTFVIGVATAYIVSYRIIIKGICNECKGLGIFLILLMLVCFLLFTWFTPQIGLFKNPITGGYGFINV